MSRLPSEILISRSGWSLRRKLETAPSSDPHKDGYRLKRFLALIADYLPSDDTLFKVSEGRLSGSFRPTRMGGLVKL